jgi:hypothetical protein
VISPCAARRTPAHVDWVGGVAHGGRSVEIGLPELRVKVPCDDERDFHARFRGPLAANGVRIPTERGLAVSTRVAVALMFRDGGAVRVEGVVATHLMLGGRSAVRVRLPALSRVEDTRAGIRELDEDEPLGGTPPPPGAASSEDEPLEHAAYARLDEPLVDAAFVRPDEPLVDAAFAQPDEPLEHAAYVRPEEPLADEPIGELDVLPASPEAPADPLDTSGEIVAMLNRRIGRARRAALVLVALALAVVGVSGYVINRQRGRAATPEAAIAAHLQAADGLVAEGRLTGEEGALEHLLAAKRLGPGDAGIEARLVKIADRLEALGARALGRADLAVASIHLEAAQLAAPERPSIRAKLAALAKRTRREASRRKRP